MDFTKIAFNIGGTVAIILFILGASCVEEHPLIATICILCFGILAFYLSHFYIDED